MPCHPYFIRVPAAPCVAQGGGLGLGDAAECSRGRGTRCGAAQTRCPCVCGAWAGKDGEQAGWRQQSCRTPLSSHAVKRCDSLTHACAGSGSPSHVPPALAAGHPAEPSPRSRAPRVLPRQQLG